MEKAWTQLLNPEPFLALLDGPPSAFSSRCWVLLHESAHVHPGVPCHVHPSHTNPRGTQDIPTTQSSLPVSSATTSDRPRQDSSAGSKIIVSMALLPEARAEKGRGKPEAESRQSPAESARGPADPAAASQRRRRVWSASRSSSRPSLPSWAAHGRARAPNSSGTAGGGTMRAG